MKTERLSVPEEIQEWWRLMSTPGDGDSRDIELVLGWRKDWRAKIGTMRVRGQTCAFRYQPQWLVPSSAEAPTPATGPDGGRKDTTNRTPWTKVPLDKLLGEALTRAGWLRPHIDPLLWSRLLDLHQRSTRVDFVLDTNALVHGSGHFLAHLFADTCALYLSAVSQRELQDMRDRAKLSVELSTTGSEAKGVLEARCSYLAAQRFREFSGLPRIAWYTLVEEDIALLLSRGQSSGQKISESDTAILRSVARFINDRVNNVERFFVSGDGAVANRAGVELPKGSVIETRPVGLKDGRIYFPCHYWPGPDQGSMLLGATPARLLWELLTVAEWIEVRREDSPTEACWKLYSHDEHLWTSQRQAPWVKLEIHGSPAPENTEKDKELNPGRKSVPSSPQSIIKNSNDQPHHPPSVFGLETHSSPPPSTASGITLPKRQMLHGVPNQVAPVRRLADSERATETLFLPLRLPVEVPIVDGPLRILPPLLFDLLAALATQQPGVPIAIPERLRKMNEQHVNHVAKLAVELKLAGIVTREQITPGPLAPWLADRWRSEDIESIALLLRHFQPLDKICRHGEDPDRPKDVFKHARSLAEQLGMGMKLDGKFLPGGENPTLQSIRRAILAHFDTTAGRYLGRAYPIYELLVEVFLKQLGVSPVRAMAAWDRMRDAGVYNGLEMRIGGSSSGKHNQEVIVLGKDGWASRKIDLEAYRGCRDLIDITDRSLSHV